jgi:hypothetical protein
MSIFYQPGRYRCEILDQALSEAKTGTPQLVLKIKVLELENGSPLDAQYEREIYRSITENTMPYFLQDLKTLGYTRDSFRYLDPNVPNYHNFAGQEMIARCTHEEGSGGMRERWNVALMGGGGTGKLEVERPLDSAAIRKLDNLFGKQLRSELGGGKSQAVAAPKAQPRRATPISEPPPHAPTTEIAGGVDLDDVPFLSYDYGAL